MLKPSDRGTTTDVTLASSLQWRESSRAERLTPGRRASYREKEGSSRNGIEVSTAGPLDVSQVDCRRMCRSLESTSTAKTGAMKAHSGRLRHDDQPCDHSCIAELKSKLGRELAGQSAACLEVLFLRNRNFGSQCERCAVVLSASLLSTGLTELEAQEGSVSREPITVTV